MEIDAALIRRLETLAGLRCDPDERDALRRDLAAMTAFVDRLGPLADAAPPETDPTETVGLRDDLPAPSLPVEAAISGAPDSGDGFFLCPAPTEEGEP